MSTWDKYSDEERSAIYRRSLTEGMTGVAKEVGMKTSTLERRLREFKKDHGIQPAQQNIPVPTGGREAMLVEALRKGQLSTTEIANMLELSPQAVDQLLVTMEQAGYRIRRSNRQVKLQTLRGVEDRRFFPGKHLAESSNRSGVVTLGIGSDLHSGSTHSQPTAYNRFLEVAYNDYNVRHFLDPGDVTTGLFGYKGQEYDIVPDIAPRSRNEASMTTQGQIWLADKYTPKIDGVKHYKLGGNHDWWHITASGIDAVAALCRQRDDFHFLEYDAADLPITDKFSVRLWHPTGGVPYALTYRLQKGVEQMSFSELNKALVDNENPKLRLLIAGHLHIEASFHSGPYMAIHPGCFEGQTNYLKRKGLTPVIGGAILQLYLDDAGNILRTGYTFLPFKEIHKDYENWPIPEQDPVLGLADNVEALFSLAA